MRCIRHVVPMQITDAVHCYVVLVVFMFRRGRIRWFKKVLVVILCYISNIKLQMDRMGTDNALEGRDQDRKLRNNLLYRSMVGAGGVRKRFKVV